MLIMMKMMNGDIRILRNKIMNINFLLVGDLSGRRIQTFANCLRKLNYNNITIITWTEIFKDISVFEENLKPNTIIKIEPPEKDMEIYRGFLKHGIEKGKLSERDIDKIDFSDFKIIAPDQWYYGFTKIMEQLDKLCIKNKFKNLYLMNNIAEMLVMMDKKQTYEVLEKKLDNEKFYLPQKLYSPKNYDEFKSLYGNKSMKVFIKLRYGSGSTGVLGYANNIKLQDELVYTSLNNNSNNFYSNYKVNRFTEKTKVKELINWVLENGAHIESWIPKDKYNGKAFDTRSFVINKKSAYLLTRMSKSPITNLHLKNQRANSVEIMTEENLEIIRNASEGVMNIFNKSLYAGIDVVTTSRNKPYIIDVNPFGDLFHNLIGIDKNVHFLEIKKAIEIIRGE